MCHRDSNVFLNLNVSLVGSDTSTHRVAVNLAKILYGDITTYQPSNSPDGALGNDDQESKELVQVWSSYVITRPTASFCWFVFALQMVAFVLYPLVHLCVTKNVPGACIFFVMVFISMEQRLLDPLPLIQQMMTYGSLGTGPEGGAQCSRGVSSKQEWKAKSRLYHIKGIDDSPSRYFWSRVFCGLLLLFLVVVAVAEATNNESALADAASAGEARLLVGAPAEIVGVPGRMTFPSSADFFYNKPQSLSYPKCHLHSSATGQSPSSPIQYLADYVFLAILADFELDTIQPLLDTWFGSNKAIIDEEAVPTFMTSFPQFSQSHAEFLLVSFSDKSAVVVVRGTKTFRDFIANAKLWLSAALFQGLRAILPCGHVFNPLIEFSIDLMAVLESNSLRKVAYYFETTAFVNYLSGLEKYAKIEITGHSLGGGLALITGAQAHVNAVGLSAPNTVLGRNTVTPRITREELEKFSFNVVPERDVVPLIGDASKHVEHLSCRADLQSSFSCHNARRALCEMLYSCGSVARPVFCECVTLFSYPEPEAMGSNGTRFSATCM